MLPRLPIFRRHWLLGGKCHVSSLVRRMNGNSRRGLMGPVDGPVTTRPEVDGCPTGTVAGVSPHKQLPHLLDVLESPESPLGSPRA